MNSHSINIVHFTVKISYNLPNVKDFIKLIIFPNHFHINFKEK